MARFQTLTARDDHTLVDYAEWDYGKVRRTKMATRGDRGDRGEEQKQEPRTGAESFGKSFRNPARDFGRDECPRAEYDCHEPRDVAQLCQTDFGYNSAAPTP